MAMNLCTLFTEKVLVDYKPSRSDSTHKSDLTNGILFHEGGGGVGCCEYGIIPFPVNTALLLSFDLIPASMFLHLSMVSDPHSRRTDIHWVVTALRNKAILAVDITAFKTQLTNREYAHSNLRPGIRS